MKVKVLYFLVPAMLVSGAVNASEIYNKDGNKLNLNGRVNALYFILDKKNNDSDQTGMCLGFTGETYISNQLIGYGHWEYSIRGNTNINEKQSRIPIVFTGLKFANLGSFDYGRNYSVIYDIISWTDVLPKFSSDAYNEKNLLQSNITGVATYRNQDFFDLFDGLNFALQFHGKNNIRYGGDDIPHGFNMMIQSGNGYGVSLTYNLDKGLSIGGAVASSRRTPYESAGTTYGKADHAKVYSGGLKYDANNIYLAAQYSQTYNATFFGTYNSNKIHSDIYGFACKAKNLEMVAQYQFDFGLRPFVLYLQSKDKGLTKDYKVKDLLKHINVGASYFFNKNISVYINHKINLLNNNIFTRATAINIDNVIALGLVYQF